MGDKKSRHTNSDVDRPLDGTELKESCVFQLQQLLKCNCSQNAIVAEIPKIHRALYSADKD